VVSFLGPFRLTCAGLRSDVSRYRQVLNRGGSVILVLPTPTREDQVLLLSRFFYPLSRCCGESAQRPTPRVGAVTSPSISVLFLFQVSFLRARL